MKNKGITLVALVVTIVIMLILAGVTIRLVIGEDGLIGRSQIAVKKYNEENEKEIIQQSMASYQMSVVTDGEEESRLGIELSNKDSINNNHWAVIQLLDDSKKIYGNGCEYVPKGTKIEDYGETQYNWIINYDTGEIINIGEDKKDYIKMSYDSGISVKDSLPLNINPLNMADETSWGDNVEFCNDDKSGSGVSGYNVTEIKFDGKDDYLKLENVEITESEGFTFEFYGKSYGDVVLPLEKTVTDPNDDRYDKIFAKCFRTRLTKGSFNCCFSSMDSKSDKKQDDEGNQHWINFREAGINDNYDYISMTVDYNTNTVTIFSEGKEVAKTTCDHGYLIGETLLDKTIPFTVGLCVVGNGVGVEGCKHQYSKFDLYSCRLYTRVLTNTEIEENYNETISYHNYLVNNS